MCYANPIFARGLERFADALVAAGVSGLIVPDLPLEEARRAARPATSGGWRWCRWSRRPRPRRGWRGSAPRARGFLYTVSLTGTTGERAAARTAWPGWWRAPPPHTDVPVAVGFGISTPEQAAAAAAAGADGVIVGQPARPRGRGGAGIPWPRSASSCGSSPAALRSRRSVSIRARWA